MSDLTPESTLSITTRCLRCDGTGKMPEDAKAFCAVCRETFTEPMSRAKPTMPCGHIWNHLCAGVRCSHCDGKGPATRDVTLGELMEFLKAPPVRVATEHVMRLTAEPMRIAVEAAAQVKRKIGRPRKNATSRI